MGIQSKALQESRSYQKFEFDEEAYKTRRNLMFFSSLALGATFVSPLATGSYEVNMGIIKGIVKEPTLIYLFLAITCLYYLIGFKLHCKRLVVRNYKDIRNRFSESLAKLNAQDQFKNFINEFEPKFDGLPSFVSQGGNFESWKVKGNLTNHAIRNYPNLKDNLQQYNNLTINDTHDGIEVNYTHNTTADDLVYLQIHLDLYWRTRKEEWFISFLPILFSTAAILAVSLHIYKLNMS